MNTTQTIQPNALQITSASSHAVHNVHTVHASPSLEASASEPLSPALSSLNPEAIKTMNLHQLGDLITRLEREMSQPTENQSDPTGKLVGNEREIPRNPGNSHPFLATCDPAPSASSTPPEPSDSPDPSDSSTQTAAAVPSDDPELDQALTTPSTSLTHRHSILLALNKEDRAFVLDLLESHTLEQTKARLAQPRPFGLNIRVSIAALHRFGSNGRVDQIVAEQDSALTEAAIVLENAAEMDDSQFILAAKHLLKLRLVRTAISPHSQTSELRALFQTLDRLRQTDLAERRLALAEKNFEKS